MVCSNLVCAQEVSVAIDRPGTMTLDRMGNVYASDASGNILKYDPHGKYELTFSPSRPGAVHLLEAWNSIKIIAFYKVFQRFMLLDRFLTMVPAYDFDAAKIGFARLATLTSDDMIWVVDDTDFSLKKYNSRLKRVETTTSLDLVLDPAEYNITFMREYQNQLFVADENSGILVFDNLGSYRKRIPLEGIKFFGFLDDELYYTKGDTLFFYHLYNFDIRTTPLIDTPNLTLVSSQYLICAYNDKIIWRRRQK